MPSYIKAVHRSKLARKSIETQIWTELKQADKKVTQNMVTAAWLSLGVTASREPDGRYWIVPDAVRVSFNRRVVEQRREANDIVLQLENGV